MNATMLAGTHDRAAQRTYAAMAPRYHTETKSTYTFQNHFHPFVAELLERLNRRSIDGALALDTQRLHQDFFQALYLPNPDHARTVEVRYGPKEVDLAEDGAYAVYNWELFFHLPVTVAVHLAQAGRHAEAQRWFHYVFDPACNDPTVPPQHPAWKFRPFRDAPHAPQIDELLRLLAKPVPQCTQAEIEVQQSVLRGLEAVRSNPFQPHRVARTRLIAYQWWVVMQYLDNLIAWGDKLFRQDTRETVNEATQIYALANAILGPRPQAVPPSGSVQGRSYRQLRSQGMDAMGNALVEMEAQFPFNLYSPSPQPASPGQSASLLGIGRALYFAIPRNDKLLGYWDTVADRLFKIRHCMNLEGQVRQLALFDPPIDPSVLVKAAAAGIDVGSVVSGMGQPLSPIRATALLQKALELCGEVRGLGAALLSALEKHDGEKLGLLQKAHEINLQVLAQDVRFLQWQEARAATEALLHTRASGVERLNYYRKVLGKPADVPETLKLERKKLTEEEFDGLYQELVGKYAAEAALDEYPPLALAAGDGPQSDAGGLALIATEHAELNVHMPAAREKQESATDKNQLASVLGLIPNLGVDIQFWGIGGHMEFGGPALSAVARIWAAIDSAHADQSTYSATRAGRIGSYKRRVLDWLLQARLASRELAQVGRQIVSSLLHEDILRQEYESHKVQIEQSRQVQEFMRGKFAGEELYGWMQGELSKLYRDYYGLAYDVARRAERAVKHELMRPELDGTDFVRSDSWDAGRKGLLAGEKLHLDLKRLEGAYQEHNRRDYELTRRISIRQLDPHALLRFRQTGKCEVTVPEWLFDLDCPGHYQRKIRSAAVSIPCVAGPYTPVSCTLSLLRSTLRRTPIVGDKYARDVTGDDPRFLDYLGTVQSVVTSGGAEDAGLFEPGARDERYLPFEGAGAESSWRLELPEVYRQFDYDTISDVVLHLRYTARPGGDGLREKAIEYLGELVETEQTAGLAQLLDLKHDFPSEWQRFVTAAATDPLAELKVTLRPEHFPYLAQVRKITIQSLELRAATAAPAPHTVAPAAFDADALQVSGELVLSLAKGDVLTGDGDRVFLVIQYAIST
jgi:hypothetical protein